MGTILILFCMLFGVFGVKPASNDTLGDLPTKERNRRLIPYMTYYGERQENQQPQRTMMAAPYLPMPQYRQSIPQRYIEQPSSLTRMITQNYLALSKYGNPRLQTRINYNQPQAVKYYVRVQNTHNNIAQVSGLEYSKSPSTYQYTSPHTTGHVFEQQGVEYNQQDEEPQIEEQYRKPAADEVIQYAKPEVQQYVTKFTEPSIRYTTQESDYVRAPQIVQHQHIENPGLQRYVIRAEDAIVPYQDQKPVRYITKEQLRAQILAKEYSSKPYYAYKQQNDNRDQTSVTITQSKEIEVPQITSTPVPKYQPTHVVHQENYTPYESYYDDQAEDEEPENIDKNLNDILQGGVSLSKSLPERITSENLDSSIKTLSKILKILQAAHSLPQSAKTIIKNFPDPSDLKGKKPKIKLTPSQIQKDDSGSTPGRPGIDYPAYDEIPPTHFSCKEQRYKGFFGDPETRCQVWHYCDLNGGQASFLCPNGTIFSQVALTCDWWFNVKCASTAQLYVLNERLYKYILPQKPSFPEDYSGPLVDHYLTEKFKEIEEKNKNKTEEIKNTDEEFEPPYSIDSGSQNKVRSAT